MTIRVRVLENWLPFLFSFKAQVVLVSVIHLCCFIKLQILQTGGVSCKQ